jgi:hypothetical protein
MYAIKGQTPVLKVSASKSYQHLSLSAMIGENGELFYRCQRTYFDGEGMAKELKRVIGGNKGKRYALIWDIPTQKWFES